MHGIQLVCVIIKILLQVKMSLTNNKIFLLIKLVLTFIFLLILTVTCLIVCMCL
jgi:hypothetical protein